MKPVLTPKQGANFKKQNVFQSRDSSKSKKQQTKSNDSHFRCQVTKSNIR